MASIWNSAAGREAVRTAYEGLLAGWPAPSLQRRAPTAQGETFVISCGPEGAPDVVLLHGSAANSASWMADVPRLARRFRVHAIDMIGEPGLSAESRPGLATGAYVEWLDEVMAGIGVERAALVGISLGGWLGLTYAAARPERVSAVAVLCPGGVGRHRNVLLWAAPLLLLGPWGRRLITARISGPRPKGPPTPAQQAFGDLMQAIFAHFRPRTERLPVLDDAALRRLTMPTLAILGAKDVFIDSAGARARLEAQAPAAEVLWLPEGRHMLTGHGPRIAAFLEGAVRA